MAKRFKEAEVNFGQIDAALAKLEAPTMGLSEVLERLRNRLLEKRDAGVPLAMLCETLKGQGVTVAERSLAHFLETGDLPAKKRRQANGAAGGEKHTDSL